MINRYLPQTKSPCRSPLASSTSDCSEGTFNLDANVEIAHSSQTEVISIPHDCLEDLTEELPTTPRDPTTESSKSESEESNSEDEDLAKENEKSDWIESVASLSCISSLMYDCQTLVNDARKSDIPNTEQWIVEARDTIK